MSQFKELFRGDQRSDTDWTFDLAENFNGAFGGTNGGVLSAISVFAARITSGRRPASVDSRYIRSFRPGRARVSLNTVSQGRTLCVMQVAVIDDDDRLCTQSSVTLVEPSALVVELQQTNADAAPQGLIAWDEGKPWRQPRGPMVIPLIDTFTPTALGGEDGEIITGSRVLFDDAELCAEAACIAADLSVGPPVAQAVKGSAATPNPDLSLRLCGSSAPGARLIAACKLVSIDAGLAATRIGVWNASELVAIGVSTTTCLPLE